MRKIYFVLFAFLLYSSIVYAQGIIKYYVTPTGTGDGSTWTNAGNPYTIDWSGLAEGTAFGNVYVYFSGGVSSQTYNLTDEINVDASGFSTSARIIITSGAAEINPNPNHDGYVYIVGKDINGNYNTNITSIIDLNGNDFINIQKLTAMELLIPEKNTTNSGTRFLIDADNSNNCIFDSLTLRNSFQWYHADPDPDPDNPDDSKPPIEKNVNGIRMGNYSIINNCKFRYLDCGIYGASVSNNSISNCFFSDNLMDARRYESGANYYYRYSTSSYPSKYSAYFHYGEGKDIYFASANACTVSNCSLTVKGSSGITIDRSSNMLIINNYITTVANFGSPLENYNVRQVDCIEVGGLGRDATMSNSETLIIKENTLINNSNWTVGHDDCIQFYVDGNTKKYYGSSTYPFRVSIYRNWMELKGADDPKNTGIIIGGWSDNNDWNQTNEEIAWREGQFTEWGIWSNIFRSVKNTGLLNINRMDANALYIFNNSFYTETTAGPQLVIYNTWRNVLRNAKIVNNIYSSGNSTYPLFKYGSYSTESGTGYPCVSTICYTDAPLDIGKSLHTNATDRGNSFINYNIYYPNSTTSNAILNGHNSIHSSATSYCCLGPNCPGDTEAGFTLSAWKNLYNNATYNFTENNGKQVNPGYESWPPTTSEDYRLRKTTSPGIDCGTSNVGMQWTDYNKAYDGFLRDGGPWDIGAYEKHLTVWSPPINGIVQGGLDAYPSPFNPTTTISYVIPKDSKVSLKVYNVLGKEISTLVDEYKSAGKHSVIFDGEDLSSGIYIYVLNSDGYYNIKKMILLK